jgi:integration host factor subunit alpha
MTLTKAHIVENLFAKNLFTKGESAQIIETLFELIKQSLQDGEDVLISGFGKFSTKEKHQRRGRNPQTGEPITLRPRSVVTFNLTWSKRKNLNGETPDSSHWGLRASRLDYAAKARSCEPSRPSQGVGYEAGS